MEGSDQLTVTSFTETLKNAQSAHYRELYDQLVAQLRAIGVGDSGPKVGDAFPDFCLPEADGGLVSLDSLLAKGPVVLNFVRGQWCPYCRMEMAALRDHADAIRSLGATPVVITPEARGRPQAMRQSMQLDFPVLCDIDNGLALACNLVFLMPERVRKAYTNVSLLLPDHYDNDSWFLPIPASYILDKNGIVQFAQWDVDFRDRLDPAVFVKQLVSLGG